MYDHLAVCVKGVEKSYGSHKILNNLCLNVHKGSIYGLLGASGCGKTTILSCIIGRNKIDKGEIFVLGEKRQEILGSSVGYMPQTLSLIGEFTVKDSIYFFGRIYNLDDDTLKQRYKDLVELLDLPTDNRYIRNCSGGQQRRVSFAVALVHKPELLILDEPTVGTDPILRERVWKYLLKISQEDKTTVIITTHYIEETRQANQIGLMREGTILIEENPLKLLTMYNSDSLEDVFLILSTKQAQGLIKADNQQDATPGNVNLGFNSSQLSINGTTDDSDKQLKSSNELTKTNRSKKPNSTFAMHRFNALLDKNYKKLKRNLMASVFPILMPAIQVLCFLIAVGKDTTDNPFGIVNEERSQDFCKTFPRNESAVPYGQYDCHINSASCLFEDYLNIPLLKQVHYDTTSKAMEDLVKGKLRGFLYMNHNLSKLIEERLSHGVDVDDLPEEEMQVYMDMTSLHIGGVIKQKIYEKYQNFHEQIHEDCKYLSKSVKVPLRMEEYFYGDKDEEFVIFMTPGIVTTMIYFMGVLMACVIILDEKCEGIWDRSIIAGVTALELSLSHLLFQTMFMVVMSLELIILVFFVFQQPYIGSLWLIFFLIYLQGLAGIVLGFGISILSTSHIQANVIVSGIFNPLVIVSGVMWPVEAINQYLMYVVKMLPLTLPTTALRNVIKRGWTITNIVTLQGVGILCLWIVMLLIFNIYIVKRKR